MTLSYRKTKHMCDASKLLLRVEAGEEIIVTVSSRASARLIPARPSQWRSWADIADLFRGPADPDWQHDGDLGWRRCARPLGGAVTEVGRAG